MEKQGEALQAAVYGQGEGAKGSPQCIHDHIIRFSAAQEKQILRYFNGTTETKCQKHRQQETKPWLAAGQSLG